MKKKILLTSSRALLVLGLLFLGFFTNCKKNESQNKESEKTERQKSMLNDSLLVLRDYLANSIGVHVSKIDYDDSKKRFVVDGDWAFNRVDLENEMKIQKTDIKKLSSTKSEKGNHISQRNTGSVHPSYAINIRVKNNCTNLGWSIAASSAIQYYNTPALTSISHVKFTQVTSGAYDIEIKEVGYTNSDPSIFATAGGPFASGPFGFKKPGNYVNIYNNHDGASLYEKTLVIVHELGHTLGLRHTNSSDGSIIPGTNQYDTWSYMNDKSLSNNSVFGRFYGFSNYDLIALSTLYPKTQISWTQISGTAKGIYCGDNGFVYGTDYTPNSAGNYSFKRYNPTTGSWGAADGGAGIKMAVASAGVYYFITADKKIFQVAYPNPIQLPGEAIDIAANSAGELYIVSNTYQDADGNKIMKWNGSSWSQYTTRGAMKIAIGPGPNGTVWAITQSKKVYRNYNGGTWSSDGMLANEIAVCSNRSLPTGEDYAFIISTVQVGSDPNYEVKRWTGVDWYTFPGAAGSSISVDDNGRPWHTNSYGYIYWGPQF